MPRSSAPETTTSLLVEVMVKLSGLPDARRRYIEGVPAGPIFSRSWVRFAISSTSICAAFRCGGVGEGGRTTTACLKSAASEKRLQGALRDRAVSIYA